MKLTRVEREDRARNWKRPEKYPSNRRDKFVKKNKSDLFHKSGHDYYIDGIRFSRFLGILGNVSKYGTGWTS